jgi:hypothetical protein
MRQLLLILLLLFPVITLAGDKSAWCLVRDENEVCRYGTAEACYEHAASRGGFCRENPRIMGMSGESRWCVVSATGRNCNFSAQRQCLSAARAINAGCVQNTEAALARKRTLEGYAGGVDESTGISLTDELKSALAQGSNNEQEQVILEDTQEY